VSSFKYRYFPRLPVCDDDVIEIFSNVNVFHRPVANAAHPTDRVRPDHRSRAPGLVDKRRTTALLQLDVEDVGPAAGLVRRQAGRRGRVGQVARRRRRRGPQEALRIARRRRRGAARRHPPLLHLVGPRLTNTKQKTNSINQSINLAL